jgi:hypothetical protein
MLLIVVKAASTAMLATGNVNWLTSHKQKDCPKAVSALCARQGIDLEVEGLS